MPTNTIRNESTMEVLLMIAPRSKPILPPKVTTAIIISEEIAPEISPKVTMIFLISLVISLVRSSFVRSSLYLIFILTFPGMMPAPCSYGLSGQPRQLATWMPLGSLRSGYRPLRGESSQDNRGSPAIGRRTRCLWLSYSAHKTSSAEEKCQCRAQASPSSGCDWTSYRGTPVCWDTGNGLPYIRWRCLP